jgi:cell division protein ZapE
MIAGDDSTRRFLHLVDEFYDRSVNLILGANAGMEALYPIGRLAFEMDRCRSRLLEMQSVEYLERPHRPD